MPEKVFAAKGPSEALKGALNFYLVNFYIFLHVQ